MATSPSPFFFPTIPPTYAPTTVFPPPPFGFGAPEYGHSIFPSAATYPPPPSPGGYTTSPFPFFYSAPSAYPYAVSFPAPASVFSQNWPPWPPPSPDPTPSAAPHHHPIPYAFPSPIPTQSEANWPPPTAAPNRERSPPTSNHLPVLTACVPVTQVAAPADANGPIPTEMESVLTELRDACGLSPRSSPATIATRTVEYQQAHVVEVIHEQHLCAELNINASLEPNQVQTRTSFDSSQASPACTNSIPQPSATSSSASLGVAGTAYVAPQVFDEMPQRYGFHNLNCQTVFRADGTKHSYFALPENYPLELATPETVLAVYYDESDNCSTESVQVCTSTPEQLTDEEEQHNNRQAPKCFSKPTFSPERPTVGVFTLTSEQSICDLEKLNGGENLSFAKKDREQLLTCSSKASVFQNVLDVYVRRTCNEESQGDNKLLWEKIVCQMATGHSIRFFPWDPGATKFTVLFMTAAGATKLQVTDVYKSEFTSSYEIQKLNSLVNLKEMIPWPICKLQLSTPTIMGYLWGVLFFWDGLPDIVWGSTPWDIKMAHVLHVKRSAREAHVFASSIMCYYDFGLGCTEVNDAVAFVLAAPCSKTTLVAKHSLLLSNSANSRTDHSFLKLFLQSLCTTTVVQVTKQRHPLGFLLMDEILQNVSEFRGAQLNCFGRTFIHLMITFGEWIHEVIIGAVSVGPLIDLHHSNGRLYTKSAYQDSAEQLIYMHQSTMINSSKLQRYMVATLSCWSPSLGNKSKIQWDPGIAFIHQQGVHENYNANNLLSSQHYLQISEMDIIFITFLPP